MSEAQLYVLVTGSVANRPALEVADMAIQGGADAIQLREKDLSDHEFLDLARQMRDRCRAAGVLFIVNDRVSISKLAGADGAHVGQDDLPATGARKILRAGKILGVSTHDIDQARQAQADGADYIGVGPIFPTSTKGYEEGVGVDFIRQVKGEITIPFFAIGGITLDRLDKIIAAGCTRVAVSSAIIAAEDVAAAVRQFKDKLTAAKG
ncbi:MAG: thiamine phosphate synthase [Planctomycetes bacterium]|nr:thiamine phosphate synthase [Planctomycetota bacterium]